MRLMEETQVCAVLSKGAALFPLSVVVSVRLAAQQCHADHFHNPR